MTDKQTINKGLLQLPPATKKTRTSRFYILPNIHQDGIPARPIVSSCGAPTEEISQFVDYYLKPFVVISSFYIKDTTDFLLKLKSFGKTPSGSLLLTLDVCCLYTNIPHEEGIETCRGLLDTRDVQEPPTDDIIKLITLILNKNNFSFNNEHYLQLKGTAMGTCKAPSYANAFMDNVQRRNALLAKLDLIPSTWWRYIADIFAIWPHGEENSLYSSSKINQFHPSI